MIVPVAPGFAPARCRGRANINAGYAICQLQIHGQFLCPPKPETGLGRKPALPAAPQLIAALMFPFPATGQATTAPETKPALPARPATGSSPSRAVSSAVNALSVWLPVSGARPAMLWDAGSSGHAPAAIAARSRQLAVASRRRPSVKTRPNSRRSQMTMNCAAMNMEL